MKLNINRNVDQGGLDTAIKRIKFCLDQLEKQGFSKDVNWETQITARLTVEEIVGALVSAEQQLHVWNVDKKG